MYYRSREVPRDNIRFIYLHGAVESKTQIRNYIKIVIVLHQEDIKVFLFFKVKYFIIFYNIIYIIIYYLFLYYFINTLFLWGFFQKFVSGEWLFFNERFYNS